MDASTSTPVQQASPVLPMSPGEALSRGFTQAANSGSVSTRPTSPSAWTIAGADTMRQGFRIGDMGLMIRYEDGSELTELPTVFPLPNAPAWFRGMANLHGALIPVFDLAVYAGVEPDATAKPMLLVLAHGADAAGIVIDGLPRRLRWAKGEAADAAMAPSPIAAHVRAATLINDQLWFDLDCAALLDALEQALGQSS